MKLKRARLIVTLLIVGREQKTGRESVGHMLYRFPRFSWRGSCFGPEQTAMSDFRCANNLEPIQAQNNSI